MLLINFHVFIYSYLFYCTWCIDKYTGEFCIYLIINFSFCVLKFMLPACRPTLAKVAHIPWKFEHVVQSSFNVTQCILPTSLPYLHSLFSQLLIMALSLQMFKMTAYIYCTYSYSIIMHHSFIHSFIHSTVCLAAGPHSLPKRVLHRMRSGASSFHFQYPLVFLMSFSSSYVFFLVFPSLLFFPVSFLQ